MTIDNHYARLDAQRQREEDLDAAREDWLVAEAYDAMASATGGELADVLLGLDGETYDSILKAALLRDPLFRMAAHQYFYRKLEKKHGNN